MTFAEGLYKYFKICPLLKNNRLNFNHQGLKTSEFVIQPIPGGPPLRRYMSRSSKKEKLFCIASNESYNSDALVNIENSNWYEKFEQWVNEQNRLKHFPDTPEGVSPLQLECVTDGYMLAADEKNAHYQIQLKLTYFQKGVR